LPEGRNMRLMRLHRPFLGCLTLLAVASAPVRAEDNPWPDIHAAVFEGRNIVENDGAVALYVPEQAEDAAIVPIAIHLPPNIANTARTLTLIIDRNPAPIAATFRFGEGYAASSDIGERKIMTRVRVDSFSNIRAVLETEDGALHMATRFVRGAGGCSAPASKDAEEALASLGRMQVKTTATSALGANWREGTVMIRHPNFTGLQMDLDTRGYTPARYVDKLEVRRGDKMVLRMEGGISISENPNLRFNYDGTGGDALEVLASDTNGAKFAGRTPPGGS